MLTSCHVLDNLADDIRLIFEGKNHKDGYFLNFLRDAMVSKSTNVVLTQLKNLQFF